MNQACQFIGQDLFRPVELTPLPSGHFVDLLKWQEGQHADALHDIRIVDIAPVLVEVIRACFIRIQPNSIAGRLSHLFPLRVGQESDCHGIGLLVQLAPDQFTAAEHVAPLIVAAELQIAAIMLEQIVEVIALHDHVVELKEAEPLLHALLIALRAQHIVDGEMGTNLPQQLHIVQIKQPVGIVDHHRFSFAEVNEAFHLPLKTLGVMVDIFPRQHFTHVGSSGGISDHGSAAADQRDRFVPGHLKALHQRQRHEVSGRQAVGRAVKADVKDRFSAVDQIPDHLFICNLRNQTARNEFFINPHFVFTPLYVYCLRSLLPAPLRRQLIHRKKCRLSLTPGSGCIHTFPESASRTPASHWPSAFCSLGCPDSLGKSRSREP